MNNNNLNSVNKAAVTRRDFLKSSSVLMAGAAMTFPFVSKSWAAENTPINVALVGCGGRGCGAANNVLEAGKVINASNPNVNLVVLADLFPEKLEMARARYFQQVPAENCYSGWDAYLKAINTPGVNYVILATPPGFRSLMLEACVEAGKNVFMEKPVATDGVHVRSIIASGEKAKAKGLSIVAGTQRRHEATYIDTIKRLQDGVIGDIQFMRVYWNGGSIWHRGDVGATEMERQVRNWYHYVWLSGDHIVEQHVHNIDVGNWVMGTHPVRAAGCGGRQALGNKSGHIWDHFAVEFEYENGVRMYSYCRQTSGCDGNVSEAVHGTKGWSNPNNFYIPKEGARWRSRVRGINPYVQEHVDNINGVRSGKPLNEAKTVAESTCTAILGREAAYSGRRLEFDEILNCDKTIMPEKLEWGPAPHVEVAIPGKHKPC